MDENGNRGWVRRRGGRALGVMTALAAAASLVFVAPAAADHADGELPMFVEHVNTRADGTEVYRAPSGYVYDNLSGEGQNYAVIHAGDMYDVCLAEGPPPASKVLARQQRNGRWLLKTPPGGYEAYTSVYLTELPVFDFFDAVCGAFFENGTPIPAPFATGMGVLVRRDWQVNDLMDGLDITTPQPRGRYRNGVTGAVADAEGNVYDLSTVADFVVRADGQPDFENGTFTVTLTPQAT